MSPAPPDFSSEQREPTEPRGEHPASPALWRRWIVGLLGSWAIVWIVAPFVVDSILVRVPDPVLGINTLRSGDLVRWRSEGWGDTRVGPHGLPGWQPRGTSRRIVLWGDSQVEGVCVNDPDKIANQVVQIAEQSRLQLDCLPMGRSGADARDWRDLIDTADSFWQPMLHVWVVTELSDLTLLAPLAQSEPDRRQWMESPGWVKLAAALRAEAIFAAAKRLARDPETGSLRRLNFRLGPRQSQLPPVRQETEDGEPVTAGRAQTMTQAHAVAAEVIRLNQRLGDRLAILYAPGIPTLAQPLVTDHPDDAMFERIRDVLLAAGVEVMDMRADFIELWYSHRRLPRGFHNGVPGHGHLNADGNRLVAGAIATTVQERLSR